MSTTRVNQGVDKVIGQAGKIHRDHSNRSATTRVKCSKKRLSVVVQLLVNIIYSSIVLRRHRQRFVLAAAVINSDISVACFCVRTWLLLSDVFIVNIFHAACVRVWKMSHDTRDQRHVYDKMFQQFCKHVTWMTYQRLDDCVIITYLTCVSWTWRHVRWLNVIVRCVAVACHYVRTGLCYGWHICCCIVFICKTWCHERFCQWMTKWNNVKCSYDPKTVLLCLFTIWRKPCNDVIRLLMLWRCTYCSCSLIACFSICRFRCRFSLLTAIRTVHTKYRNIHVTVYFCLYLFTTTSLQSLLLIALSAMSSLK